MQVISSFLPFAPISWCAKVITAGAVRFDKAEHFEKMSYRNRYTVNGANNVNQLSIPLVNGRNQRIAMSEVLIHNDEKWQVQHWRTLVSVYKRSPYWEFYEITLQELYETEFTNLIDFNLATFEWLIKQLKVKPEVLIADNYLSLYPGDSIDLRGIKPSQTKNINNFPKYYQVFEDRIGFMPDLSILDLLFSEGPQTKNWLLNNSRNL